MPATKASIWPLNGWCVTSPLLGRTVGMVAQSVWPGSIGSLQSLLSRMVPLVPITSTLNW
jgi:hypothetical protein